ncbi:rhodanese-like domain-containing protein [Nocardioides limicola]|uniref:rhodanese-like domain-containing protein n=1 Tax=Nocardioides limicola TaxID=2803368 RepID=UPI00193C6DC3|nr:rhodanese-like domain-containing protein [Nocardioides sp. DJM-14]
MPEEQIDQVATAVARGAAVIDVREPSEFAQVHAAGAVNIPMGQLAARTGELDMSRPVYVICASGNRSAAMTDLLRGRGFDAINVAGGTAAWLRAGHPVRTGVTR